MTRVVAVPAIALGCLAVHGAGTRAEYVDARFDDGPQSVEVVQLTEDDAGSSGFDTDHRTAGEPNGNYIPSAPPAVSGNWDTADLATVRLAPDVFPDLSKGVAADLSRRGCLIPQPWLASEPANVVYGRFTVPGQVDAAVLCSIERVSSILVYRGNSTDDVAKLATVADRGYLQDVGGDRIGFSREIRVADAKRVRDAHASHGGPEPLRADADGIEDFHLEKASSIWLWHDGKWFELAGSD